ncbi:hypothetical protein EW146_g393 [Bondarzewia mesenterica]|uniref:Senescence domain-containing protein n=1 Tax=Bondarzewia mesenterica TaxID=1095465 RepID=A0A4S4MDF0_9AGAM|nr:hypothetical protein EW146_g393 [Bondarzewia mesenterica]
MTTASNYYIAHSTPSPHPISSKSPSPSPSKSPPPPSRMFLLLQSPNTRQHLTRIHALSGQAVNVSKKTVMAVEGIIGRVVGAKSHGNGRTSGAATPTSSKTTAGSSQKPPLPPRNTPGAALLQPQPRPPIYTSSILHTGNTSGKAPLPPRRSPSLLPPSNSPVSSSPEPTTKRAPIRTQTSLALSAGLLLSTLAASSTRLVDAGGSAFSAAVTHKYGTEIGDSVRLAAGTVGNVVLVYVDVAGMGRRAIVKKAAEVWVRGKVTDARKEIQVK